MSEYSDDYYRTFLRPFDAREEAFFGYLRSLTPWGELAEFLGHRSAVWQSAGEYLNAIDAAAGAVTAEPECRRHSLRVFRQVHDWVERLRGMGRIGHGYRFPTTPIEPRRWPDMPWDLEAQILWLDAAERGTIPN